MTNRKNIPDFMLEQYLLGELNQQEIEKLKNALANNKELQTRLEELKQDTINFKDQYPSNLFIYDLNNRKMSQKHILTSNYFKPAITFLICLVSFIIFKPILIPQNSSIRSKGLKSEIEIFLKNDKTFTKLQDSSIIDSGDIIQIRYTAIKNGYGAIFSIDGNKSVTIHLDHNRRPIEIEPGKHIVKEAFELDNAPNFEIFYYCFSESQFLLDSVISEIHLNKNIDSGISIQSYTLLKNEQ